MALSPEPMRVLITGAAGQIGYALAPMVARGAMLGPEQTVILHLLDIPFAAEALEGVRMELVDAAFPLVKGARTAPRAPRASFSGALPRRMSAHGGRGGVSRACASGAGGFGARCALRAAERRAAGLGLGTGCRGAGAPASGPFRLVRARQRRHTTCRCMLAWRTAAHRAASPRSTLRASAASLDALQLRRR